MRDKKKLATERTRPSAWPSARRAASPASYAAQVASTCVRENNSVTLTLMPSRISVASAVTPAAVAGILIMALGRSIAVHSRRAASTVPSASCASAGETSG